MTVRAAIAACFITLAWTAAAEKPHWAFQEVDAPPVPKEPASGVARTPVDAFLIARLQERALDMAPDADAAVWFRRLHFNLTGLPPSSEDVRVFLADTSPAREARWMDRLLASPAYGERRAQLWLDLARFAESDGFEFDHERKEAWRYRDWVIEAFNADLPYDDFVRFQLAGDELRPGDDRAAEATGFLLAGPDMVDINLPEERRHNALCEMTAAVGSVFLGLTTGCAQCHDHRSDPVSLRDYYAFQAYFANTVTDPKRNRQLGHRVKEPGRVAPPMHVKVRGDFRRPGDIVEPALFSVIAPEGEIAFPPMDNRQSSNRRARLATALTQPENPLVSRVIVNRLWQDHFGKGLVATPSDFGALGARPSHPELLDWLAAELPRRGWSMKNLQRLLLTSHAFRQTSFGEGDDWQRGVAEDPDNTLYWRAERRRLSGEHIRDHMLRATGRLNRAMGGPGVRPPLPPEVTSTLLKNQWNVTPEPNEHLRRSVYLFVRRNLRFPMFDAFDKPDPNATCARRNLSTTAPQSLTLLNSKFTYETARALAKSLRDLPRREAVKSLYWRLFSRAASEDEVQLGEAFLEEKPRLENLTDMCLALLNINEMIYVD